MCIFVFIYYLPWMNRRWAFFHLKVEIIYRLLERFTRTSWFFLCKSELSMLLFKVIGNIAASKIGIDVLLEIRT